MSDLDNPNPAPPRPTIKTSAVPLKKETVRITLRPQVPQAPEAPTEYSQAGAPPAPMAPPPRPSAPTPPPRPMIATAPPPSPTGGGAPPPPSASGPPAAPSRPAPPAAPLGSKTIPLAQPPARPGGPIAPRAVSPVSVGAPVAQSLPRATVKLQPATSSVPSSPVSVASIRSAPIDLDDEFDEGPLNVGGLIALIGAIAALLMTLACMDKGPFATGVSGDHAEWARDTPTEGFKLPADFSPFDSKDINGTVVSKYDTVEPKPPTQPE